MNERGVLSLFMCEILPQQMILLVYSSVHVLLHAFKCNKMCYINKSILPYFVFPFRGTVAKLTQTKRHYGKMLLD